MLAGHVKKSKERIQKFKETGDSLYIYQNEPDKASFQHDMAHGDLKYLTKKTASVKLLRDKKFDIAKNPKYYRYQKVLASMIHKFFDEKILAAVLKMRICQTSN